LKKNLGIILLSALLMLDIAAHFVVLSSLYPMYSVDSGFRAKLILNSLESEIVRRDNSKLPDVEIANNPIHKFNIIFYDDKAYIHLNRGLIRLLSDEEMKALLAHELAHPILGHRPVVMPKLPNGPRYENNVETIEYVEYNIAVVKAREEMLKMEIEADRYASRFADKKAIAALINQLVIDDIEKEERLHALGFQDSSQ